MGRTALFSRRQKGGVYTVDDLAEHPGEIYFADSGHSAASDSAGFGNNPDAPQGDTLYLMPGHAETLASAGALTVDVAGISIIGLGHGDVRPTFTFATAAAASVVVSACDCTIENIRFVCNITNQNHMIDLSGDDFTVKNCSFVDGTASGLAAITADTDDGDSNYTEILDCLFYSPGGNGDAAIQIGKDHTNWLIQNNDIYGDYDEAGIDVLAGGDASALLRIYDNRITQVQAGDHAIQISGTAVTGWAVGNKLQTNAQASAFDASALSCHDNTWLDSDGTNDEEAIPANTQHAGGTAVVALAADALGAANIADDAFSYEHFATDAPVVMCVVSPLMALDGNNIEDVFTVTGPVELYGLVMQLTEAVSAHACAVHWELDPTIGASSTPICGTVDINGFAIGDCVYVTGAGASAQVKADVATAPPLACAVPAVLFAGGIDFVAANDTPTSGIANVYLMYRALVDGATVTAA